MNKWFVSVNNSVRNALRDLKEIDGANLKEYQIEELKNAVNILTTLKDEMDDLENNVQMQ